MDAREDNAILRALIVDDTVVYRKILADVIHTIPGVQVAGTAPNGKLALARMEQAASAGQAIDLVLLDVEMPEMGGLETLEIIRKRYPETGVIMVSGVSKAAARSTVQALERGALDFIRKPEGASTEENVILLGNHLRSCIRILTVRRRLRSLGGQAIPYAKTPAPETLKSGVVRRHRGAG